MDNFNINENTMNKLKDMMNNGDLSQIMAQIPPDMLQNFSSMMQNNNTNNNSGNRVFPNTSSSSINSDENVTSNSNSNNNFDFSNIDINTIMKIKSVMEQMNNTNDPRSNLLNSLKPYLRDNKKEKLDQYANLINIAKITELFNNNNNKETPNNG